MTENADTSRDAAIESGAVLAGHVAEWACEEIWSTAGPVWLDGQKFRAACSEELRELGYPEDDSTTLVLRRESDGAYFEVEFEPAVRRVQPKQAAGPDGDSTP